MMKNRNETGYMYDYFHCSLFSSVV